MSIDGWRGDDEFFGPVSIDVDEWRDGPARYRYVHGSFAGTDTRFAVCLPDAAAWNGRLVQFLQGGMGGDEHAGMGLNGPAIAFDNGALYCESNQGHVGNDMSGLRGDQSVLTYRASRATALAATALAEATYGELPHHRYVYGGSGGGLRAIECLERCPDVWDGAVPFIINRTGLLTFNWSILCWATSLLGDRMPDVVDATDAGGTGDPFAVLDGDRQREALAMLYRAGFCRGAESQITPSPLWVLGLQLVAGFDPGYFEDFWTAPGYAGTAGGETVERMYVAGGGVVAAGRTAGELARVGSEVDDVLLNVLRRAPENWVLGITVTGVTEPERLLGATLRFTDGAAAGREVRCTGLVGDALTAVLDPQGFRDVAAGDQLTFDTRDLVAFAYFHRHMVSGTYPEMADFVVDNRPIHPQRPIPLDALPVPSGQFEGKMILIQHGADRECWPNTARAYASAVADKWGDAAHERFRLWWHEHAAHTVPHATAARTRYVSYGGAFAQAVGDLVAWVEDGTPPPESTAYSFGPGNDLRLPATANQRKGVQPVVTATADGSERADVQAGSEVHLAADVDVPPGAGAVVSVAWDFDGSGRFAVVDDPPVPVPSFRSEISRVFAEPGTYFVTVRVTSHRDGFRDHPLREITNLARVRVVVAG